MRKDVPGDRLGDGRHDRVEVIRDGVVFIALDREALEEGLRDGDDRRVGVEVIQQRHGERRCKAGSEDVDREVRIVLRLVELAVAGEDDVLSAAVVQLPDVVVAPDKPFEEPLRVRAVKDVHGPLTQTVENFADVHRNIHGDVLVEIPAFVVDRRRWNAVNIVVIEHAVF